MENITDADYTYAKGACKDLIKKIGWVWWFLFLKAINFLVYIATVYIVDVFNNFRNMCLEIHELDPAHFISASGLSLEVALNENKLKLDLLTDIDMLIMVEKGIRGGICLSISR